MSSRIRGIKRDVRSFDQLARKDTWATYQGLLRAFVADFPQDVQNVVNGMLRSGSYAELVKWADSFANAVHVSAFAAYNASQLAALIKKYPFPAAQLKEESFKQAIRKFLAAEERCKRYNLKLKRLFYKKRKGQLYATLEEMRRYIRYVLGETPNLSAVYAECSFGPGASIGVHGQSTNLARKLMSEKWTCTPSALPYAKAAMATDEHIFEFLLRGDRHFVTMDIEKLRKKLDERSTPVHYNKIVTVPKTVLVDRTIAVEPLLNGYLQKGVDNYMRRLLKRVGIDLSDQTRNQRLAKLGSYPNLTDPFTTIDLSSASDSLSLELVKWLLPPDWYQLLDAIRSPAYKLPGSDGDPVRYHKFTSMGNGFCFPLETLIFASVCNLYSRPTDYSVYGDDIAVRQSVSQKVIKTLWEIGFRHNVDKTFLKGPFRESCGADWFEGVDIRPLALDYELDSLSNIIKFYNMSKSKPLLEVRFVQVREYLMSLVPLKLRLCRPYLGNIFGAFEVPLDMFQSSPFSSWRRDTQCWSWYEVDVQGRPDFINPSTLNSSAEYSTALMMAAVRGSPSAQPFSKRRETSQSVRVKSYAGASSSWLPPLH